MRRLVLFLSFTAMAWGWAGSEAFAQQELTLYFMDRVHQSTYTNPALFPKRNFVFAVPPFSQTFNAANTGFTYNDFFKYTGDSIDLTKNISTIYNEKLEEFNYAFFDINSDFINTGFRINKWRMHFGLNATEKMNFRFKYHKDVLGMPFIGNTIIQEGHLDFSAELLHYREYGLTIGYSHYDRFTVGAKVKLLHGLGNLTSPKSEIMAITDTTEAFTVTAQTDYLVNTSGIIPPVYEIKDSLGNTIRDSVVEMGGFGDYFLNTGNPGLAFDAGASYTFKLPVFAKKFTVAASVLDLGYIKWRTNVMNLHSNGTFTFSGLDINNLIDSSSKFSIDGVYDTLNERFKFKRSYDAYQTSLIAKTYISARMALDSISHVGVMFFGEFFDGMKPAVTVEYDRAFGGKKKKHTFVVTWSYKNRSFLNLGFGWQVRWGPVQFFACGDNLSAYVIPKNTKSFNLRFGMNLVIGKTVFREPPKKQSDQL